MVNTIYALRPEVGTMYILSNPEVEELPLRGGVSETPSRSNMRKPV